MQSYVQRMFQSFAPETSLTPQSSLVALESVIEAAVNAEDQPEKTTTDKLNEFVSCLKNDSMVERYTPHFYICRSCTKADSPIQNVDRQKQGQQEGHPIGGPIAEARKLIGEGQTGLLDLPTLRFGADDKQSRLHCCAASTSSYSLTLALISQVSSCTIPDNPLI